MKRRVVYLGADHAGFKVKEKLKKYLDSLGIFYEDLGGEGKEEDDYPDYAFKVAEKVSRNRNSKGILICGTGTGMVIAANKIRGIRAAVGYDDYSAKMAREHDDANILCLRGRNFSDKDNLKIVRIWLNSRFSNAKKHNRRLRKIGRYER